MKENENICMGTRSVTESSHDILLFMSHVFYRETRRLLERLVYVPCQDLPATVVQVASWYLLRHLHGKNDEELMKVSVQLPRTYRHHVRAVELLWKR